MEIASNIKRINGLIYKLSLSETLRALKVNEEITLTKSLATYGVTNTARSWIKRKDNSYNFTIQSLDKFQDKYIVKRIPAK